MPGLISSDWDWKTSMPLWREKELVTNVEYFYQLKNPKAKRKIYPVDASGELPNGESSKMSMD